MSGKIKTSSVPSLRNWIEQLEEEMEKESMAYTLGLAKAKKKMDILAEQPEKQPGVGFGLKTYFLKQGNTFTVSSEGALDLHEKLPVGNYVVKVSMDRGFYLEKTENFSIPSKIYGDTPKTAERILNTFHERNTSTGVLLCGQMGSGKTLLAKLIGAEGASLGIPTLIVNSPFCGDAFNSFIATITQPVIVFFDEFEKVYDEEHQQALLTLFDGVFGNKKLFLTTSNNKWKIDVHMKNRPGRFFYFLEFFGLDYDFIREYCELNLLDQKYTEQVCVLSTLYEDFNFDMLQALVEEVNRYDESPRQAVKFLNVKPTNTVQGKYTVTFLNSGQEFKDENLYTSTWGGSPLTQQIEITYAVGKDEDGDIEWEQAEFTPDNVKFLDVRNGIIKFKNSKNQELTLTRKADTKEFDYEKYL